MTDIETKALDNLLTEITDLANQNNATLLRPIVPIDVWVDSPYYLGETCYGLYPKFKQHLRSIFDEDRDESDYIDEVIMSCSIGTGKTTLANVIFLRKLYELSCYTDIRPLYNLMASKKLLMVYFSITREVAENTGYAQLRDMILNIPYFNEYFSPNTKKSYDIEFPDYNMAITSGSRALQALGGDVIASTIDEGDFYGESGKQDTTGQQALSKAQQLYSAIRKRARSRFMVRGRNYSLNMIISSPTYASSFITNLIRDNRNNPHAYIIEETLWTVKPKGTYSDQMFLVFKGTPTLDPVIVEDVDFFNTLLASEYLPQKQFKTKDVLLALADLPEHIQNMFIQVPIDFKSDFEVDLITALQDIASVPTSPLGRLFTSSKHYGIAVKDMVSPFTQEEITISTSRTDNRTIQTYFKPDYKPEHPELPRFIHFDQSITGDEAGVACSYAEYLGKDENGAIMRKVTTEWMMRIVPPKKPEQIDLKKMRSILYYMRNTLHLRIALVTFDSYASEEAIQVLRQDGFNVELKSVDRDDTAYTDIVQLYYQELYKHPDHKRYREELFGLVHFRDKHKVDHPPECFTKDTKIRLVDGRSLSIEDLQLEHSWGKTNYVYSMTKDGIRPRKILDVFKTKYVKQLLKVTLDNGEVIKCTPEHPFMMRDGSYKQAKDLKEYDSLMPLYTTISNEGLEDYRMYYEPLENEWHYEHRQFCNRYDSNVDNNYIVHHENFDKLNNNPSNLKGMTKSNHIRLHNLVNSEKKYRKSSNSLSKYYKTHKNDPVFLNRNKKIAQTLKDNWYLNQSKEYFYPIIYDLLNRLKYDKFSMMKIGKRFNDLTPGERSSMVQLCNNYLYPNVIYNERKNNYEKNLRGKFTTKGKIWINNGVERKYILPTDPIPTGYHKGFKLNHKVASIEYINEKTAVYDLTIDQDPNFALDAGVFVHNCDKGVADATVASAHSALTRQDIYELLARGDANITMNLM